MANKVLDSWALIAFFEDGPSAGVVEDLLDQASNNKHRLFLSLINWAEIYSTTMQQVSVEVADKHVEMLRHLPIEIVGVAPDIDMAKQAAIYMVRYEISFANAFAAALAKEKRCELVTGDAAFQALDGEIKLHWLSSET